MILYSICRSLSDFFHFNVIPLKSIHVDAPDKSPILFYGSVIFHVIYVCHLFVHLSVNGHLGYFPILAIVNNAAVNIGLHISFQISVLEVFWIYSQEWNCWIIW